MGRCRKLKRKAPDCQPDRAEQDLDFKATTPTASPQLFLSLCTDAHGADRTGSRLTACAARPETGAFAV
jgi:hypothetical protein